MILLPAVTLTVSFFLTIDPPEWTGSRTVLIAGAALCSGALGLRALRVPFTSLVAALGFVVAVGAMVVIREAHRVQLLGDSLDTTTMIYAATRGGASAFIVSVVVCAVASAIALRLALSAPDSDFASIEDVEAN